MAKVTEKHLAERTTNDKLKSSI